MYIHLIGTPGPIPPSNCASNIILTFAKAIPNVLSSQLISAVKLLYTHASMNSQVTDPGEFGAHLFLYLWNWVSHVLANDHLTDRQVEDDTRVGLRCLKYHRDNEPSSDWQILQSKFCIVQRHQQTTIHSFKNLPQQKSYQLPQITPNTTKPAFLICSKT